MAAWGWLALRLFMLLRAQALWRGAIGGAWDLVAAGLAVVLAAAWRPGAEGSVAWGAWLFGACFEAALGAVLGVLVSLPGEAARGAARCSGHALGLARPRAWEALHLALAGALGLALELHRPLLAGLHAVATRWPVGAPASWSFTLEPEVLSTAAGEASVLASSFGRPQGLAVDAAGDLFVVDALAGASGLYRLSPDGDAEPELVVAGADLIGVAFDRHGGFVLASNDTLWRFLGATGSAAPM